MELLESESRSSSTRQRNVDEAIHRGFTKTRTMLADDREDIALSDALQTIEQVQRLYEANVTSDPQLRSSYATIEKFFSARAAAIRDGISRKRSEKTE